MALASATWLTSLFGMNLPSTLETVGGAFVGGALEKNLCSSSRLDIGVGILYHVHASVSHASLRIHGVMLEGTAIAVPAPRLRPEILALLRAIQRGRRRRRRYTRIMNEVARLPVTASLRCGEELAGAGAVILIGLLATLTSAALCVARGLV